MKIADTISVNPSKTALGHVDPPASSVLRSPVLDMDATNHSVDLLKILFPSRLSGNNELRKYEVPLRTLFSTLLIIAGILLLEATTAPAFAICSLCFGAFLAVGLFTRPMMLGASIFYCVSGALSIRHGQLDFTAFTLMFGCLIFAIAGAGKYSLDNILRAFLRRAAKNRVKKAQENFLGYKAFHKVKF